MFTRILGALAGAYMLFLFALPFVNAASPPLTSTSSPFFTTGSTDLRAALIEAYLSDVIACTNATSSTCTNHLVQAPNALPPTLPCTAGPACANPPPPCSGSSCPQFPTLSPAQAQLAAEASVMGNDLFKHLGTLFVLDNLFRYNSNGLLSPNGTSLGDLLVLYQLFFSPTPPTYF